MIKLSGKLIFDPENKTNKHDKQSEWKKVAMIVFDSVDICKYYAWFIEKRYNLVLNMPLRGAHVTIINDRASDINNWEEVKKVLNNTQMDVYIDLDARTDSLEDKSKGHWWLRVLNDDNPNLMKIREMVGLNEPYYSFHMTIGYANEKNIEHSKYIHNLIKKYGMEYN